MGELFASFGWRFVGCARACSILSMKMPSELAMKAQIFLCSNAQRQLMSIERFLTQWSNKNVDFIIKFEDLGSASKSFWLIKRLLGWKTEIRGVCVDAKSCNTVVITQGTCISTNNHMNHPNLTKANNKVVRPRGKRTKRNFPSYTVERRPYINKLGSTKGGSARQHNPDF